MASKLDKLLRIGIALVWLGNGLFCKVLDLVPRHESIVARILGEDVAPFLTPLIGLGEIVIAIWVLSGWRKRWNTYLQIALVAVMNVIEFLFAKDLLLWGGLNFLWASVFICFVWYLQQREERRNDVRV